LRIALKLNAPEFTSGQFLRCGAAAASQAQQAPRPLKRRTSDKSPRPRRSVVMPVARKGFLAVVLVLAKLLNLLEQIRQRREIKA
jgi:hypothetical protein